MEKIGFILILTLTLSYHLYSQMEWLRLPLFNDEFYYASPQVISRGFFSWPHFSFGHPPGWPLVNWLAFHGFGTTAVTARFTGWLCSVLFLIFIPLFTFRSFGFLPAILCVFIFLTNDYFLTFSAHNQPLILTALMGVLSIFSYHQKKYLLFLATATFCLLLRESSLAFVVAALLAIPGKKKFKIAFLPFFALALCFLWSLFVLQRSPINPQMNVILSGGQSIFVFEWSHIFGFYNKLFSYNSWLLLFLALIAFGLFLFHLAKKKYNALATAFFLAFVFDSAFFSLYRDYDLRNFFISSVCLTFFSLATLSIYQEKVKLPTPVPAFLGILSFFYLFSTHSETAQLQEQRFITKSMKTFSEQLQVIREKKPLADILSTNPITYYLNEPFMGYVNQSLKLRWHGGAIGYTKILQPDYILVPLKGFENPITEEMRKFLQENSSRFELLHREDLTAPEISLALFRKRF